MCSLMISQQSPMASYGILREEAKKETIGPGRCNSGLLGLLWWIGWGCRISRFKCTQSWVTVHMPLRVRYWRTGWMLSLTNKLTAFIVIYRGSSVTSALVTFPWRWWSCRSHHPYYCRCHYWSFQIPNILNILVFEILALWTIEDIWDMEIPAVRRTGASSTPN